MTVDSKWRMLVNWLRKSFPLQHSVSVRRYPTRKLGGDNGDCAFAGSTFRIRVNRNKSFNMMVDTLLHEYAHAMVWYEWDEEDDPHIAEWGVAYAKLYRAFWAWEFGRAKQVKEKGPGFLPGQKNFIGEPED